MRWFFSTASKSPECPPSQRAASAAGPPDHRCSFPSSRSRSPSSPARLLGQRASQSLEDKHRMTASDSGSAAALNSAKKHQTLRKREKARRSQVNESICKLFDAARAELHFTQAETWGIRKSIWRTFIKNHSAADRRHKQSRNLQVLPLFVFLKDGMIQRRRQSFPASHFYCLREEEWVMVGGEAQYLLVVVAVWPIKSNDGMGRDGDRCWWSEENWSAAAFVTIRATNKKKKI